MVSFTRAGQQLTNSKAEGHHKTNAQGWNMFSPFTWYILNILTQAIIMGKMCEPDANIEEHEPKPTQQNCLRMVHFCSIYVGLPWGKS